MSELDVRLAEINRRLQEIQAGLAPDVEFAMPAESAPAEPAEPEPEPEPESQPGAEPEPGAETRGADPGSEVPEPASIPFAPPVVVPGEPPPSPRSGPLAALLIRSRRRRSEPPADEIAALVQMHNGLMTALGELVRLLAARAQAPGPGSAADRRPTTVSAGPFASPEQVEAFTAQLSDLPPVRAATVVGYEGADRALIEVQLGESG